MNNNSRTIRMLRILGKVGAVGAGIAASIAATVVAVNASCEKPIPAMRSFPCDKYQVKKWNFNWDGLQFGERAGVWSPPCKPCEPCPGSCPSSGDSGLVATPTCECPPKARRHIILIRHGQYNNDGTMNDECHTLTDLGLEQAAYVGRKLDSMGVKFTSITSSGMIRAKQTACTLMQNLTTQPDLKFENSDPLLNEGCPCVPEPPYRRLDVWNPGHREVLTDGSRIETAFQKYFHRSDPCQEEDSYEIIVCHGNVIRYFACRALQFPPEGWLRMAIDHCSITRVTILPTGEVTLRALGDSGHIPFEKTTF